MIIMLYSAYKDIIIKKAKNEIEGVLDKEGETG